MWFFTAIFLAVLALQVTRNDGQTAHERMEGRKQAGGRMEGWKDGRMEGWKDGRVE